MRQPGEDAPLALEAAAILFIPARMRDLLQRHALHRIAEHALRQPHPPHTAPAQLAQDAVLRHLRHGQRIPALSSSGSGRRDASNCRRKVAASAGSLASHCAN